MTVTADSCLGGGDDKAWPPGFRFHPTDEELVVYYLKRKICKKRLKLDIIRVLDVYKWDPEDLPGQSILRTGDRQWFFFTPRDRKYPNGARSNRATGYGYWKATGKDRNILCNSRSVGIKKTLVFYRGRSPNGERTDWVMHEYTLDEEELNRCSNICDYYALYKVYKKSGPGPKNGEQYGAPFKEEDWLDDDCADDNNPVTPQIPVKKHNDVIPGNNSTCAGEVQPLSNDMEEFMRQITDENALDRHQISDDNYVPPQVAVEKELQSTLVDLSFREVFPEPDGLLYATSKQENKLDHFKFDQSDASKVQLLEAQEVTSGTSNCEWVTQPCEEDFLEIADLIGPKPISSTTERPPGNLQFDEFDGLSELDFYHDALANMVSVEQETVLHSCVDSLENHMVNNVGYLMQPHLATNQADCQLEPHEGVTVDDYLLQSQLCGPDQINYQFWVHDQSNDVFAYSESIDGTLTQPNLGVGYECTNSSTGANENQNGEDSAGTSGLLSSTIWSFLDSIPSTPASAAESRLVNNAVKRMSSFSRLRLNIKNTNIDAGDVASSAGSSGRNKGLIFLSIFGAFCAVLWVLVGTLRVTGRSIS